MVKQIKLQPLNITLRVTLYSMVRKLKRLSKVKKREYKESLLQNLNDIPDHDYQKFWPLLKHINKTTSEIEDPINWTDFVDHFKTLGSYSDKRSNT